MSDDPAEIFERAAQAATAAPELEAKFMAVLFHAKELLPPNAEPDDLFWKALEIDPETVNAQVRDWQQWSGCDLRGPTDAP